MYTLHKQSWSKYPVRSDPEEDKYGKISYWEHLKIPGLLKSRKRDTNVVIFLYNGNVFRRYSDVIRHVNDTE